METVSILITRYNIGGASFFALKKVIYDLFIIMWNTFNKTLKLYKNSITYICIKLL